MKDVFPSNTVNVSYREGVCVISVYSLHAACFFPQHGPGKKHTRLIYLADWQQDLVHQSRWEFLGGLLHSDGCRSSNVVSGKDYPRWSFANRSEDILEIFYNLANVLGLRPTRSKWVVHIARRTAVSLVDAHVAQKS